MRKAYLELGKIVGTHGVRGELRVDPWCDSPDFAKQFHTVYAGPEGQNPRTLVQARPHKNMILMTLEGVDTMEAAEALRGTVLYIRREDAALSEKTVFVAELIGCTVRDADCPERVYGTVTEVSNAGASDIWHIRKDGAETLMPNIPGIVVHADIDAGVVTVRPIPGIFDDPVEIPKEKPAKDEKPKD